MFPRITDNHEPLRSSKLLKNIRRELYTDKGKSWSDYSHEFPPARYTVY